MVFTASGVQRRKNTRHGAVCPTEENTGRKTKADVEREKKEKKPGVFRRLGMVLTNDKSETGSTLKKRNKKKNTTHRKRSSVLNAELKCHFLFQKPHSHIPLKGDKITEGQKQVYHKFANEMVKRGPAELSIEFMTKVKPYIGLPMKREVFDANPTKNRYKDVVCNDITRVAICDGREDALGDYIHANYVHGLTSPFILTQGPLDRTTIDFWRMIVHSKAAYIVMLCEVTEDGKPKCSQYYPEKPGASVTFGDFTITCKSEEDKDEHVNKSVLLVKTPEKEHMLRHLHTKTWPDKFVPNSMLSVLRMLYIVRSSPGPVVVHCSAGIGRTGTFVAIEACLQTLTDEKELELVAACKALRNSRLGSVQVDVQYMTLVQIILNYGKDNGYWDDPDLDDRIELLTWNITQFVQTRGKPHAGDPPVTPALPAGTPKDATVTKEGQKDSGDKEQPAKVAATTTVMGHVKKAKDESEDDDPQQVQQTQVLPVTNDVTTMTKAVTQMRPVDTTQMCGVKEEGSGADAKNDLPLKTVALPPQVVPSGTNAAAGFSTKKITFVAHKDKQNSIRGTLESPAKLEPVKELNNNNANNNNKKKVDQSEYLG